MQRKQSGAYDTLDVRPMKFQIELEGTDMVAARSGGDAELAIDLTHLTHDGTAAIDGQRRRLPGREPLEMADDAEELAAVVLGERRDDQSLIAADARRGHEPFLLQAMQGTTHRRSAAQAADAELGIHRRYAADGIACTTMVYHTRRASADRIPGSPALPRRAVAPNACHPVPSGQAMLSTTPPRPLRFIAAAVLTV